MAKKSIVGVFAVALLFILLFLFLLPKDTVCMSRSPAMLDPVNDPPRVPVNVETRGFGQEYGQLGILTRGDLILPLMGRRFMPDRWQYYTISNTGNLNTKLPITFKGRSCSEGCDEMVSGDSAFVEGYRDTFRVTVYEKDKFLYIPL